MNIFLPIWFLWAQYIKAFEFGDRWDTQLTDFGWKLHPVNFHKHPQKPEGILKQLGPLMYIHILAPEN